MKANETRIVNAARKLRCISMLDSATFMIDEMLVDLYGQFAYNASEVIPVLLSNVQPNQVLDTSSDGTLFVVEGSFGYPIFVEYDDDIIDVKLADSEKFSRSTEQQDSLLLFPDSQFAVEGRYPVSVMIGVTLKPFSFSSGGVVDGCISVDTKEYDGAVREFICDTIMSMPEHRTKGFLYARNGAYNNYYEMAHDQISVILGTIKFADFRDDRLITLVQILDAKIREAKAYGFYSKIIDGLVEDFPDNKAMLGAA